MREIWIVDDDEEMSRAIGLMFKLLECKVTMFFNVRSAAQNFASGNQPDLIILDLNMPEISGIDMIEFLRRRPDTKNLPIGKFFNMSAEFWMNLQVRWDMYFAQQDEMAVLKTIEPLKARRTKIGEIQSGKQNILGDIL